MEEAEPHILRTPIARRKLLSVVAAGHSCNEDGPRIRKLDPEVGKPATILKVLDENEHTVYNRLKGAYANDPVHVFIPTFHGVVEERDEKGEKCRFIRIDNLLHRFSKPKVMDIKLGTRTFLESECKKSTLRPDLFKRLSELYPEEITDADREAQAVTKHRFMQARDANSTIHSLGYRVDGIAGFRSKSRKEVADELAKFRTLDDTCNAMQTFIEVSSTNDGEALEPADQISMAEDILASLEMLRTAAEESAFVKEHEFIGSSILIVADATGQVGVFWIDFAKTLAVDHGCELSHRLPWEMGNHEDGVQFGLDNLVKAWGSIVAELRGDVIPVDKRKSMMSSCSMVSETTFGNGIVNLSDLAVLSLLPAFSGVVADRPGTIWEGEVDDSSLRRFCLSTSGLCGSSCGTT